MDSGDGLMDQTQREGGNNSALVRRKLPKLMACLTKTSLENLRNKALFSLEVLDARGIRRRKLPIHECLVLELDEAGFGESSNYLQDLIYDNVQLVNEDDIGIVVDIRTRRDYLEHICAGLQKAEKHRDKGNSQRESIEFLTLAMHYSEQGKGMLWLAEKLYHTAIAVASQYLVDGGRQKACCKYHYASFLLDKFPGADPEEPFVILTEVRDSAIGKDWLLEEFEVRVEDEDEPPPAPETIFSSTALQLHRVLLSRARMLKKIDTPRAERLSRLAERRARDAGATAKTAEAIIEIGCCQLIMNNLNNAQKTFDRAYKIFSESNNVEGLCETKMHLAAVMQRLGDYETAARLLTEMGALAMQNGLRRQLGRALHLLGELHLRRERPELGTQHLSEAFGCFMGFTFQPSSETRVTLGGMDDEDRMAEIYKSKVEIYEEEAEQSRLMMGISAGQELMASYFNVIRESRECAVAQMKIIEWKLEKSGWWLDRKHHKLMPCLCQNHNRTPLDVLRIELEMKMSAANMDNVSRPFSASPLMDKFGSQTDMTQLHSSFNMK